MRLILLFFGHIAIALCGTDIDCFNDYNSTMSCQFKAENCTEYQVTLRSTSGHGTKHCPPKQKDIGNCSCSVDMMLIDGEFHIASVSKEGKTVDSKTISIAESMKPNVPTIISVKETNGNFQVLWNANSDKPNFRNSLNATVTYYEKGSTHKEYQTIKPPTVDNHFSHEILGENLKPGTTYVVSVKSILLWNNRSSDSSDEYEFTTPASYDALLWSVIVSLSVAAAIVSGVTYLCYVKLKAKWWDSIGDFQNFSKVFDVNPKEQELFKPSPPIISSIFIERVDPNDSKTWSKASLSDSSRGSLQQSSGISTGSPSPSYAHTEPVDIIAGVQEALDKAFLGIGPLSAPNNNLPTESNKVRDLLSDPYNPCGDRFDGFSSKFSGIANKTYAIIMPSCPPQEMIDTSEIQAHAGLFFDSAYCPSAADMTCPDKEAATAAPTVPAQQDILLPTVSHMRPVVSNGQCNVDSRVSSNISGTNTTPSCDLEPKLQCTGKSGVVTIVDEKPSCLPASSHSFPPVDDDYQPFQTLLEQPNILLPEPKRAENSHSFLENSSTVFPQSCFRPVFPGITADVRGSESLYGLQTPFLSLMSAADQSMHVMTDSGYQAV